MVKYALDGESESFSFRKLNFCDLLNVICR